MKSPRQSKRFETRVFDLGPCRLEDLDDVAKSLAFAEGEVHESQVLLDAINRSCDDSPDPEDEGRRLAMRLKQHRLVEEEW